MQTDVPAFGSYFWLHFEKGWRLGLFGIAAMVLIAVSLRWSRQITSLAAVALIWLFPFFLFACGEALWSMTHPPAFPETPPIHISLYPANGRAGPASRVVWIIFDEWDYRLSFPQRAGSVHLPEIDRLANESLTAEMAFPPAGRTLLSIPALLAGRLATRADTAGPSELLVTFAHSSKPVVWGTEPNILSSVAERGWISAMAGWCLPYRRIFNAAAEMPDVETGGGFAATGTAFVPVLLNQMRSLVESRGRSPFGQSLMTLQHRHASLVLMREAAKLASDPSREFVFLHLPVTHTPFFYDRRTGGSTLRSSPLSGYLDHLELADHLLGAIRRAMERAGVWDNTTLLLSSDHWNRASDLLDGGKIDHRIPFMLKLARQTTHVSYPRPFNTVVSQALLLAAMDGEITSATDAIAWMNRNGSGMGESPYNRN